jgi:ATP-dependent DNA ligase
MLRSAVRPIGFIEPCQPSSAPKPPIGPGWIHEIKHDGYRMMCCAPASASACSAAGAMI